MKFIPLGLIATLIVSVSARPVHDASLVDLSGNTVSLDHTVSDSLNGLNVVGNANGVTALVLPEDDGYYEESGHPESEAESEVGEDLQDEFEKRSSVLDVSHNVILAQDTASDIANGATITDNLNRLTAHVLRRSSVIDASGNVVSVKKTVHNVGNGISVTDNVNDAVAKVINTRDTVGVKGITVDAVTL
jgi:hypothetical protein